MKTKSLTITVIAIFISSTLFAKTDTLSQKTCDELISIFKQTVEQHAKMDMVFYKQFFEAKKSETQYNVLEVGEITGNAFEVYLIDFSKLVVGQNVYVKDWGKGYFSVVFSKDLAIKKKNGKPKKFEIPFAAYKADRKTDYAELAILIKETLEGIQLNCK